MWVAMVRGALISMQSIPCHEVTTDRGFFLPVQSYNVGGHGIQSHMNRAVLQHGIPLLRSISRVLGCITMTKSIQNKKIILENVQNWLPKSSLEELQFLCLCFWQCNLQFPNFLLQLDQLSFVMNVSGIQGLFTQGHQFALLVDRLITGGLEVKKRHCRLRDQMKPVSKWQTMNLPMIESASKIGAVSEH